VVVLRETIIQACEDSDVGLPGVDVDRDSSLGNYFQARAFRSQQLRKSKRDISYFLESPRSQQSLAKVCDAWGDTLQDIVLASYTRSITSTSELQLLRNQLLDFSGFWLIPEVHWKSSEEFPAGTTLFD
jgi:hypothetical protein